MFLFEDFVSHTMDDGDTVTTLSFDKLAGTY